MILDRAVERARMGCEGVRQQGAWTKRARAREDEQRGGRAPAQAKRAGSVLSQRVKPISRADISHHEVLRDIGSGQLPDLG